MGTPASRAERDRLTAWLLQNHGVRVLRGRPEPTVGGPLGGARGVWLEPDTDGASKATSLTAYHPSQRERRRLLRAAIQTLQGQGWQVTVGFHRSPWREGRKEPYATAIPRGRDPYGEER